MIGQVVNYRYEVLEKIGDGELFSVYKSRDKVLNRLVALKILTGDLTENKPFATSLCSGYQNLTALAHPKIARVLDADYVSGNCYVASEYVRGINVKERIRRAGAMTVPLALDVIVQVLEALEYAHANKIVHGDIRSQDIIVSPDGEAKLTDFGLSTSLVEYPVVADRHTMRSVRYQAPEVAEGTPPTMSSDLYSVGVVLYEMVTGSLPFDGATAVAVALKRSKETPPPPRSINTAVSKSLNDIILRSIENSPSDRYPSAAAMAADLRAIRDSLRVGKPVSIEQPAMHGAHVADEAEEVKAEGGEKSFKKMFLWLMLIFVVTVVAVTGITMLVQRQAGKITVPPLLGKTWDEAQYEAREKGIRLVDDGEAYSDLYQEGQICSVLPPTGGTVSAKNPIVKVKISKGPNEASVPDLKGMNQSEASDTAVSAGLVIGSVTQEYSDSVPSKYVISQTPAAGSKAKPNSSIDIVISKGAKPEVQPQYDENSQDSTSTGEAHKYNIAVQVQNDADGAQEVKVVVNDDNGENIVYDQPHEPGDRFTIPVTTYGTGPRIRVYVGGKVVSDDRY